MSAPEFFELQTMAMLLRGNGYGLHPPGAQRRGARHRLLPPGRVMPFWSGKAKWYRFTNLDGTTEDHHQSDGAALQGAGPHMGRLRALSPIQHHAQTIGIGLAARDYTAGQFERGLLTNDYFGFPAGSELRPEQRKDFKEYLRKRAQGVANAHNPLLLENGAEWKRVGDHGQGRAAARAAAIFDDRHRADLRRARRT
jgi:phage portal protein BeeE